MSVEAWTRTLRDRGRLLHVLVVALTVAGGAYAVAFAVVAASDQFVYDAHAYWAVNPQTAYLLPEGDPDAMLYAPPVMLVFSLFHAVPWPVFATVWSVLIALCITFMAGPFTLPLLLTNPIASEVTLGNIHAFTGMVVIAGFRRPAVWAFVLLTKVTPGVGLLWFVFRREWRNLGIALGATAVLVIPTVIIAPDLWVRWAETVLGTGRAGGYATGILAAPLWARMAVAVVLLWFGARRDWAWTVPIAATLGLPVLWDHGLTIALASIWLLMHPDYARRARRRATHAPGVAGGTALAPGGGAS